MKMIFRNFLFILLAVLPLVAIGHKVFLQKKEASQYLGRQKRAFFEEFRQGNAERECVEEVCNYEEAREVFENDALTIAYWNQIVHQCETNQPCNGTGAYHCENKHRGYTCTCLLGYSGERCEIASKPEHSSKVCDKYDNLCVNGGTCVNDEDDTYYCDCLPGWYGRDCAQDINECEDSPCVHGSCLNHAGSFECICHLGYEGKMCGEEINECDLNACPEGTTCQDGFNSYLCLCPEAGCLNIQQNP